MANNSSTEFFSDLRIGIVECFDMNGLKILCADLNINFENIEGGTVLENKALELINYSKREGRLADLLQYCLSHRPRHGWPPIEGNQELGLSQQEIKKLQLTLMMNQERGGRRAGVNPSGPARIDINNIIQFNLEQFSNMVETYRRYEGVLAFALDGSDTAVLENYLLGRLKWELTRDLPSSYDPIRRDIYLNPSNARAELIEAKLTKKQKCQRLADLFTDYHTDLLVCIWNYGVPRDQMLPIAAAFCQKVRDEVDPILQGKSCRLILIWFNVGGEAEGHYCYLRLPTFQTARLAAWFGRYLTEKGVAQADKDEYLESLESTHGDLVTAYKTINDIIQEIQGGLYSDG